MVKTTGNSVTGIQCLAYPTLEFERYAINATFTIYLLHSIYGVGHVNLLPGPSNGLDLHFFAEALQEDMFGNPLLKDGDAVIMDNCGFHHARCVERLLGNVQATREIE